MLMLLLNQAKDMYLISDDSSPLFKIGYCEEREEEPQEMDLNDLSEPNISKGDWGWLCSDFEPVYDSKGECLCFVGCDFGMDDVMKARNRLHPPGPASHYLLLFFRSK